MFGVRTPLMHARRDSNPQPTVLETATLPIELLAYSIVILSEVEESRGITCKFYNGMSRLPLDMTAA